MYANRRPKNTRHPISGKPRVALLLIGLVALGVFAATPTLRAAGLVLWNKLGSDTEALNSAYGPNLQFYRVAPTDEYPVIGNRSYVPGVFGGGITIGPGSYWSGSRVHTLVLNNANQYISSERGTIEFWYKQMRDPVPYANGVYRLFDGDYGLDIGCVFDVQQAYGLRFGLKFGGTLCTAIYDIRPYDGTWMHVAGVWDRAGIDGSADKLRLYVNGQEVAATSLATWGTTVGPRADICGANDNNISGAFYMDNLKVFDYAVTDFSHRLEETYPLPEPTAGALLGLGALMLLHRRSRGKAA